MSARYFQGTTVTGQVKASAARTFKEVVDTLQICPVLPLTREAFLALDEKRRNEAKQVPFFVPACFKESPSKRVTDEATHCNLIFLDIDPEKCLRDGKWEETGHFPAAPFVANPQLIHDALKGFNFAAHVTASSTPERPRMRIIVDAEHIALSDYPAAALTIAALLGLSSVTKESKVAVQPMFLPVLFQDTPLEWHPLLTKSLDDRTFTSSDINHALPASPSSNGANGHHLGTNGHAAPPGADALDFLRAPVPEISLGITKEALAMLDADCSRQEWLNCAAGLKHQFSPKFEAEAFELFDEWSRKGKKYEGEKDTQAAWKSLRPSPVGRVPVTIRSLLRQAVLAGWDDKKVRENCFSVTMRWFEDVPTVVDLMEHGVRKILATPLLTAMQEDMLISNLCAQAKSRFAQTISATAVRKDMARMKAEMQAQSEPEDKPNEKWAQDVCYIIGADEFYRYRTGEKIKPGPFDMAYARHLIPSKKDLAFAGTPVTTASLSTPVVSPSKYALNKLKIPQAQDYAYEPAQPNNKWFVHGGSRLMNTYSATYPAEDPTRAAEAGALLQRHLRHLVAEAEYRKMLLDFMAFQVQAPGRKCRFAVLIQSVEGAGKTFLAEVMKAVLGAEHVKTIDGASIKSGWNEWAFGKQLVVLEEVKVSGTNKHEIMNSLKPLITNDDISVNERFRNNRQVRNISNYMIFSNHHDALALTPGDRRYFVIKSPLQTKAQVLALGDNYFPPLYAMLRDHPGAMRSFLMNWEISPDFRPDGHAPRTKYVQDMVNDSANDLTATIRRLLLEGDVPLIQYDIVSATELRKILMNEEGLTKVTAQAISQVLREEGLLQTGRHLVGDERHYLWSRPDITEAAAAATITERHKKGLRNLRMELRYAETQEDPFF